jgi:branched-chain amino acid transport system substrate-binding protein
LRRAPSRRLKLGITTFLPVRVGVRRAGAEQWMRFNAAGSISSVKITPVFIDEGIGGDKLLSEYRRLVQEQGIRTMLSAISSGNCNIVAPVAEDLKVLNVMWDCGTEKVLEEKPYKYVVRTQANAHRNGRHGAVLLKTRPIQPLRW